MMRRGKWNSSWNISNRSLRNRELRYSKKNGNLSNSNCVVMDTESLLKSLNDHKENSEMTEEKAKKVTVRSTKQELLDAYNSLVKELEEKRQLELNPERKAEEKVTRQAVKRADDMSLDGVSSGIGDLKGEIAKTLTSIGEKMEAELTKFQRAPSPSPQRRG